jgi:hypothetical protein
VKEHMWFLVVPEQAYNGSDGRWVKVRVDTAKAADRRRYRRPWDYYDTLCGPNHVAAAVSRVPPKQGD